MHDKYESTRIPSSFKCDSTNKHVLGRSGTGYLTQYVPALRDTVHSHFSPTAVPSTAADLHSILPTPLSTTTCRTGRMAGLRCDGPHRHTHTHTHTAHTRASPTHTHTALAPTVLLGVSHSTHKNSFYFTLERVMAAQPNSFGVS